MTRSRKQAPVVAMTTAESNKAYKVLEHRRARRAEKVAVSQDREPPDTKAFGSSWKAPKDGKQWYPLDPRVKRK